MSTKQAFRIRLYALIGVLALLCILLAFLTWLQGPHIRLSSIDLTQVTTQPGQRLVLQANQPLAKLTRKQITISPKVPLQVTASGNTVLIQFAKRLRYHTTYRLRIQLDPRHQIRHSFTTLPATVYYQVPHPLKDDEIRQRTLGGTTSTIFSAPEIVDYTVLMRSLAVNTRNHDYTNSLHHIDTQHKQTRLLLLPRTGTIGHLRSMPDKQAFGFSFTAQDAATAYNNALFIARAEAFKPKAVSAFNNQPLRILDWQPAPDSTIILAHSFDTTALLVDSRSQTPPTPLGQFSGIIGFTNDDAQLVLEDTTGKPVIMNVATRERKPLRLQSNEQFFVTRVTPLSSQPAYLLRAQMLAEGRYLERLVLKTANTEQTIYDAPKGSSIVRIEPSPNDQYVAIELALSPQNPSKNKTIILDLASNKPITTIQGSNLHWQ